MLAAVELFESWFLRRVARAVDAGENTRRARGAFMSVTG